MGPFSSNAKAKRRVAALASMAAGTVCVLGLIVAMNAKKLDPPKAKVAGVTSFEVESAPKPPKAEKKRAPPKKRRTSNKPPPPAPLLAAGLSGVDFGLPSFDDSSLGGLDDALLGDMKDVVMTADSVDDPPRPISQSAAPYPPRARQRGVEGYVTLSLLVSADGSVSDIKVIDAQPKGVFEDAALSTLGQWRFSPGTYQGEPVNVRVRQTLKFELS